MIVDLKVLRKQVIFSKWSILSLKRMLHNFGIEIAIFWEEQGSYSLVFELNKVKKRDKTAKGGRGIFL
jgi:hypothetical protein